MQAMKQLMKSLVVVALLGVFLPAGAIQLVTKEEMLRSLEAPPVVNAAATPADPLAPQIVLVDPEANGADKVVRNPFKMEVIFKPQEGAALDFKSFQALYGSLKMDITERLLKEAVKTPNGLRLANVSVPSGKHRILLRIKDSQNRLAEKEIQFRVD
jgi:hypothetical protein